MVETCALDVADRGGETLQTIGHILGLTRERVRQIEEIALRKMRRRYVLLQLNGHMRTVARPKRPAPLTTRDRVLTYVESRFPDPTTVRDASVALGMTRHSVASILHGLGAAGCIERIAHGKYAARESQR